MSGNVSAGFRPIRHDQLYQEATHDPYRPRQKLAEPSVCSECGVVYHEGRWRWGPPPEDSVEILCPACARERDEQPAGHIFLGGSFFTEHMDEVMNLVAHQEERQKDNHPLQRIMDVSQEGEQTVITTTDIHLARDIGTAIHDAYQGELDLQYNPDEWQLRVHWRR